MCDSQCMWGGTCSFVSWEARGVAQMEPPLSSDTPDPMAAVCQSCSQHKAPLTSPAVTATAQSGAEPLQQARPTRQKAGRVGITCQSTFSMVNMGLATPLDLEKRCCALHCNDWADPELSWLHIWVGSCMELLSNE